MTKATPVKHTRLLVIDVCGTLYHDNTTSGLIALHHKRQGNPVRAALIKAVITRRLPFTYILTILSRLTGIDIYRFFAVRSLRGEKRDAVDASARAYTDILATRHIAEVHETVANLRVDGWEAILVSNSISPIIERIGAVIGIPVLCSELEWTGDVCTGRIVKDLTGQKKKALEALIGYPLDPSRTKVITDNRTDSDLVAASADPVIVLHRGHSNWTGRHDVRIIRT